MIVPFQQGGGSRAISGSRLALEIRCISMKGNIGAGAALAAVIAAAAAHFLVPREAPWAALFLECATLLGDLFAALLKASAPFVVFLSLLCAFLPESMEDQTSLKCPPSDASDSAAPSSVRRVWRRAFGLYVLSMTGTAAIALVLSLLWWQGKENSPTFLQETVSAAGEGEVLPTFSVVKDLLGALDAFSGLFTGYALFAVLLCGAAAGLWLGRSVRRSTGEPSSGQNIRSLALHLFLAANAFFRGFLRGLLRILPLGLFGLLTGLLEEYGAEGLARYGELALFMAGVTLFVGLLFLPLLYAAALFFGRGKTNFGAALREAYSVLGRVLRESALPAFATRSSLSNIPVNLALASSLGLHKKTADLLVPLAAVLHMPGAAVTIASVTVFCAAALGVSIDGVSLFVLLPATVLAAAAASGIPNGSVLMLPAILGLAGVSPADQALCISVYFAADILQDAVGTALNSSGDIYLAAAAERSVPVAETDGPQRL